MTRYRTGHKERTRARLVEAAREAFRLEGFDRLSIDRVMRAAGLTRGGFYAHFESKESLVREVLGLEAGLVSALREAAGSAQPRRAAVDVVTTYLSAAERASRVQCPLVAHGMDARRGGAERSALYEQQFRALVGAFERVVADGDDPGKEALALATTTVGAAHLSVVVADPELASRIERHACSEVVGRLLPEREHTSVAPDRDHFP